MECPYFQDSDFAEIDERRVERVEPISVYDFTDADAKELEKLRDMSIAPGYQRATYWDVEKFMDDWGKKVKQLREANGLPPLDPAP